MDEEAFQSLFETYKNRVYGYVLAISHSDYAAEELTQEIFIKLWLCRDILIHVDNLEGYIFAVARNKTLNHLRKATNDAQMLQELQSFMKPLPNNNTDDKILSAENEKLLREAVTMLSPQRRLVYDLSRGQGLNHEQIANHLKLSRNTVKNHLVEALRFIREYLGQRGAVTILLILFIVC